MRKKGNNYLSHNNSEQCFHRDFRLTLFDSALTKRLHWLQTVLVLEDWIGTCDRYILRKTTKNITAPSANIESSKRL